MDPTLSSKLPNVLSPAIYRDSYNFVLTVSAWRPLLTGGRGDDVAGEVYSL
jgi:hypothetical protein